jgi:hypothetical protein
VEAALPFTVTETPVGEFVLIFTTTEVTSFGTVVSVAGLMIENAEETGVTVLVVSLEAVGEDLLSQEARKAPVAIRARHEAQTIVFLIALAPWEGGLGLPRGRKSGIFPF